MKAPISSSKPNFAYGTRVIALTELPDTPEVLVHEYDGWAAGQEVSLILKINENSHPPSQGNVNGNFPLPLVTHKDFFADSLEAAPPQVTGEISYSVNGRLSEKLEFILHESL